MYVLARWCKHVGFFYLLLCNHYLGDLGNVCKEMIFDLCLCILQYIHPFLFFSRKWWKCQCLHKCVCNSLNKTNQIVEWPCASDAIGYSNIYFCRLVFEGQTCIQKYTIDFFISFKFLSDYKFGVNRTHFEKCRRKSPIVAATEYAIFN